MDTDNSNKLTDTSASQGSSAKDSIETDANVSKKTPQKTKSSRIAGGFLFITFLLSFAACLACVYLWYLHMQTQSLRTAELTEFKRTLRSLDEHPTILEFKNHTSEQNARFAQQLHELTTITNTLEESVSNTMDMTSRSQRDWVLFEVEYLIRMSHTRMQLMRDPKTAAQALLSADQRLASLADPRLINVRKELSTEITLLKNLEAPDIDGALLRLSSISRRLPQLPLATTPLAQKPNNGDDLELSDTGVEPSDDWWSSFVSGFKRVIGFRPEARPSNDALARKNIYYLDQLLRLEIESARQAAIRLDKEGFEYRLSAIKRLLDEHYDQSHEHVIILKQDVAALQQLPVFNELPELSGSLEALLTAMNAYTGASH